MRIYLCLIILVLASACRDTSPADDPLFVDLNGSMKVFFNAQEWNAEAQTSANINYRDDQIHIEGFRTEGDVIVSHVTIKVNGTTVGAYDNQTARCIYYDVRSKRTFASQSTCTVDINEIDVANTFISGTFTFTGINQGTSDQIEFLSGEFKKVNLTFTE
jgi:hypothetical protein